MYDAVNADELVAWHLLNCGKRPCVRLAWWIGKVITQQLKKLNFLPFPLR